MQVLGIKVLPLFEIYFERLSESVGPKDHCSNYEGGLERVNLILYLVKLVQLILIGVKLSPILFKVFKGCVNVLFPDPLEFVELLQHLSHFVLCALD